MSAGRLMPPGGANPPLDGKTPDFEEVGADPTVAPGLDRPPGSICRFNGVYYWHNDTGATAWVATPFSTGGGGSSSVASWALTVDRYFFIDYDAGDDSKAGFLDAAPGSTFTALQTAAVAIKTVEQLYALVPQVGNGRFVVILQKNRAAGANYLDKDAVTQSSLDTSRWSGYRGFLWRGSSDLSNDAADRITCGFIVAVTGPGAGSSFAAAAGATTTTVPIAAGAIAAEAATQFRVRFLPTTATAALRNICRVVTSMVVDTSVTLGNALPAVPAAGDVFVIERPGVRMNQCNFDARALGVLGPANPSPQIAGLAFTTTTALGVAFAGYRLAMAGIEQVGTTANGVVFANFPAVLNTNDSYQIETSASVAIGMGVRYASGSTWIAGASMTAQCIGAMNRSATHTCTMPASGGFGSRSYLGGQWTVKGSSQATVQDPPGTFAAVASFGDSATGNAQPRVTGHTSSVTPFAVLQFPINLWRLNFENFALATHGCVYLKDIGGGAMSVDGCTGDGTANYGMDLQQSFNLSLFVGTEIANTVAGTLGEVILPSAALARWSDFTKTNVVDVSGNNVQGTAGALLAAGETVLLTSLSVDGVEVGSLINIVATGVDAQATLADWLTSGGARCDGVAITPAPNVNDKFYAATSGAPYVVAGVVTPGALAYVGSLGKATAALPGTGKFQGVAGRWLSGIGTTGSHGRLILRPQTDVCLLVEDITVADGNFGDTSSFTLPVGMALMPPMVILPATPAALIELAWGFDNIVAGLKVYAVKTTGPSGYAYRFVNRAGIGDVTITVKAYAR